MFQLEHPRSEQTQRRLYPGGRQGGSNSPRMVSAAPSQISAYHLPIFTERAPWSLDVVRGGMTKEQIRLKRDCVVQRTIVSRRQKGTCAKLWTLLKGLFPCSKKKRAKRFDAPTLPFIQHDRRTAYEYAHPMVNRVQVRNSTFRCSSSVTITADDLWRSLYGTDDAPHAGNWPGGTILPPLPYDWSGAQFPSPPSHNIRLNPHLQHYCSAPHPIAFDIARGPNKIMHNVHAPSSPTTTTTTPLDPVHLTQPATYPPVTHMHIQVVAEDPLPHIPWPIEVANARGITCGDVFDAISQKLLEHISEEEYNTWTRYRKEAAARAYHQRVRMPVDSACSDGVPDIHDGLRRIDYMGERVVMIFHGLEQASATMDDIWFMFFGASERSEV